MISFLRLSIRDISNVKIIRSSKKVLKWTMIINMKKLTVFR